MEAGYKDGNGCCSINRRKRPTSGPTQPMLLTQRNFLRSSRSKDKSNSRTTDSNSPLNSHPRPPPLKPFLVYRKKQNKRKKKSKQTTFRLAPTTKKTPYHPPANRMMISRVRLANLLGSSAPSTRKNVCVFHSIMSVFRIAYIAYNSLHHQLQPLATRNPQGSAGRVQEARAQKGADAPAR